MRKILIIAAFAATLMSCAPRAKHTEMPPAVAEALSSLPGSDGKESLYYALVELGKGNRALLVTSGVYDDLEGHMASIEASVFSFTEDGTISDCGCVRSQGTSYPLAVRNGELYVAGHRFIDRYSLDEDVSGLIETGSLLEVLDSLGEPLHYVLDKDMVCVPGDSLVEAAFNEWSRAEVISFIPVGK